MIYLLAHAPQTDTVLLENTQARLLVQLPGSKTHQALICNKKASAIACDLHGISLPTDHACLFPAVGSPIYPFLNECNFSEICLVSFDESAGAVTRVPWKEVLQLEGDLSCVRISMMAECPCSDEMVSRCRFIELS
jgi:hypothetical protein